MKKLIVLAPILLLLVLALASCGQTAETLNNEGNEAFANQDYTGALVAYQQAAGEAPELAEPYYNAANTYYRLEDYEQAQQGIEQALLGEESQPEPGPEQPLQPGQHILPDRAVRDGHRGVQRGAASEAR